MSNNYTLPILPSENYYWELKRRNGAYSWSDQLTIFKKRKYWFDKNCGQFNINGWHMDNPLTTDEIMDKAEEFVRAGLEGPLTPITGYRYNGRDY